MPHEMTGCRHVWVRSIILFQEHPVCGAVGLGIVSSQIATVQFKKNAYGLLAASPHLLAERSGT